MSSTRSLPLSQPGPQPLATRLASPSLHFADGPLRHTKTRPEIKWTVNELAAVKGEIDSIGQEMGRLAKRKARLERVAAALTTVAIAMVTELAPEVVVPIRAHGRYGGRGNLRNYLRETLKAAHPKAVSTGVLVEGAVKVFGLTFSSREERARFADDNLGNALRKMLARGEVERLHDYAGVPNMPGVWRWRDGLPSWDELERQEKRRAKSNGVRVGGVPALAGTGGVGQPVAEAGSY